MRGNRGTGGAESHLGRGIGDRKRRRHQRQNQEQVQGRLQAAAAQGQPGASVQQQAWGRRASHKDPAGSEVQRAFQTEPAEKEQRQAYQMQQDGEAAVAWAGQGPCQRGQELQRQGWWEPEAD